MLTTSTSGFRLGAPDGMGSSRLEVKGGSRAVRAAPDGSGRRHRVPVRRGGGFRSGGLSGIIRVTTDIDADCERPGAA
ncbi:hypothetical protein GCM10010405_11820 [Streptomyces macrosporus]|uniref:Uncharacterized protein n=1 Tax=Streptomyces macrosporus TaxID=44032 RepID=A0ABN3JKH5_9ACTN